MKLHLEQIKGAVDNVVRYLEKEVSLSERMSANIKEIATFAAASAKDVRAKDFFTEDFSFDRYLPPIVLPEQMLKNVLEENRALADVKLSAVDSAYIADFCAAVTARLRTNTKLRITPSLFAESATSKFHGGRVAFAESHLFMSVFAKFSKRMQGLTSSYVRSFTDACNDVSAGVCDYCILPVENSREGILVTVYGMIERYDLFISRVCTIESDELTTKFALLCPRLHGIIETLNRQYIDLRLLAHDQKLWSRIYTGAAVLGVDLVKTVSVPLGYTDGYAHICTFDGDSDALFAFLLFLSVIRADYTLIGIYEEIA